MIEAPAYEIPPQPTACISPNDLLQRVGKAVDRISLPKSIEISRNAQESIADALGTCRKRVKAVA